MLPVLTYTAPARGRATRCAGATRTLDAGARARAPARPRGRRLPVAHDPRARSARATGRRAPPRSTSTPTSPTPSSATRRRPATTSFEREVGARAAGRDGAAVALARPPRRRRALPHRRRHRARRVQRDRRQQRLHEPDGRSATCARPPTPSSAIPSAPRELGVDDEETASWRDAAAGDADPLRRGARRPPPGRGLHRTTSLGLRRHQRRSSTRCCCTSPTSTSTASRSSSRPTWCSPCTCCGDAFSAEEKARNFAYYERADRPRLVAVGVHAGGHRRRGRPPRARLRLPRARRR